jgi:hypothetical protein
LEVRQLNPGTTNAQIKGMNLAKLAERHRVGFTATWVARNKAEYDRGVELGMIGGWHSWEHYEAQIKDTVSQLANVRLLEMTPDEILAALEQHELQNTPEDRSKLYSLLAANK